MRGMIGRYHNILNDYIIFRKKTEKDLLGKLKSTITRRLNTKRNKLPGAIISAVVEANYTSGK